MTDTARAAAIRQNQALLGMLLNNTAFKCSLSGLPLTNPVILKGTGLSYDRLTIEARLATDPTDPETGRLLTNDEQRLLPNPALRDLIRGMIARVQTAPLFESEANGPVSESATE